MEKLDFPAGTTVDAVVRGTVMPEGVGVKLQGGVRAGSTDVPRIVFARYVRSATQVEPEYAVGTMVIEADDDSALTPPGTYVLVRKADVSDVREWLQVGGATEDVGAPAAYDAPRRPLTVLYAPGGE